MNFPSIRLLASLGVLALVASAPFSGHSQAAAVATGDTRTVTEPVFPATCQRLQASFHDVSEDVPLSVENGSTNLDQVRLQAALTACASTGQAVQLSMDSTGNNAFLSGPLTLPAGVTLLLDPGVTLYFSRNAQDYDMTPGTHTCGTVSGASSTASCKNLITISRADGAGIMGYGKLNGRGGDVVLNSFATAGYEGSTAGKTWWDIANDATTYSGSQQNPRGIQVSNSNNVTFYKFTFKNAPNFHVALNTANGFTAWDIKIVTPYTAHNTDGIDPGNSTNVTIKNSWISDGDDNVAVGAPSALSSNMSIVSNRFFAGHGESIGSYTTGGVSNILFDSNMLYGDADVDGSNSTGIRIKSANDRGSVVQNIQYSNSCFANHGTQIQFTPLYNTNTGTLTPNFKNILLQNLRFANTGAVATGSFTFLGASNNGTVNPLVVTLDNVTVDTIATANLIAPSNAQITLGPGQVSTPLVTLLQGYNGTNGNIITDARRAATLLPPACTFTFLAPELTGPAGVDQTVVAGQFPTAAVLLTPAIASTGYPYPTGTVTVTDEGGRSTTATLSGTGDTTFVPITNAPVGTHTYTASYAGNSVYPAITSFGPFHVNVSAGSLSQTTTTLSGVPAGTTYGSSFNASAAVGGSSPLTGSVSFLLNGAVYATVPVTSGSATYTFNLPLGSYTISAVYAGDSANAGSFSTGSQVAVAGAPTTTNLTAASTTSVVGTPVPLTATVASSSGTPAGTVTFTYTSASNSTPTTLGTATLTNGQANYSALLPQGTDNVFAIYAASGNFGGSTSTNAVQIVVSAAPAVASASSPLALPYTISTIAGGATSSTANTTCTGHADTFGDGCQATQIMITGTGTAGDLRSVVADPFGNVYFTDANAALVRQIATNGVVSNFAGYITGTACVPSATVGCTPTLVKLSGKPRGIYSDSAGNIYIAGYGDNKVQYVRVSDGKMYLLAGTGSGPTNTTDNAGDGGPAVSALLKGPRAAATDTAGNIYVADSGDNRIREIQNPTNGTTTAGYIQTVAGTGAATSTGDGGLATSATISNPQGVAVDTSGNVYISESSKVRAVCVACAPGGGLYALLNKLGVASPVNGNIYTVAGTSSSSNTTLAGGLGNTVNMGPQKIALDPNGNLYIADSSNNAIWFEDGRTGYVRLLAGGGTATSCTGSAIGDGCQGTKAIVGSNGNNGFGLGLDVQGNLYISDSTDLRIRKLSNNLRFPADAVSTALTQPVQVHFLPGDTPQTPVLNSPDFSLGAGACTTGTDTTTDCLYTATFAPVVAGLRIAPVSIATANGNGGVLGLSGTGTGAGATLDPARQMSFGQNVTPAALAVDTTGAVYVADADSKSVLKYAAGASGTGAGSTAAFTTLQTFNNPTALALDSLGNVFVADAGTGLITEINAAGTSKTLATVFSAPSGLAVDSFNNLYVADSAAKTVTEISSNLVATRTLASGLNSPLGLAVDGANNVFIADPGAGAVYRVDAQTLARTTASSIAAAPRAVAVDAAGNLLIADASGTQIVAVPTGAHSAAFPVVSSVPGTALALDSVGNVYTAQPGGHVLELLRTQATATYTGASAPASTFYLLSTGNVADALSLNDPDQTNFKLGISTTADCSGSASALSVVVGGVCQFSSSFTPGSATNFTNTVTLAGNAANAAQAVPAGLQIVQIGNNGAYPTTVSFGAFSPAVPYTTDTVIFNVTVASSYGTPTGSVVFAVDGIALNPATVVNGMASISVSGLSAGTHQITAVFTSNTSTFAGASATPAVLTVQQVTATVQNVWVVNGNRTLSELSNSGGALSSGSGYAGGGSGITIDATGNVWSGTASGSTVVEFSKAGAVLGSFSGGGITSPTSLSASGTGYIWISNANNTLSVLDNSGNVLSPSAGFNGGGLNMPSALAIDSSGNVWVTNSGDSSLTEFLGAADPVQTPLSVAAQKSTQGSRP